MKTQTLQTKYQGVNVIRLYAGGYAAMIAPTVGSNLIQLADTKKGMNLLRYDKKHTMRKLKRSPEVYGLPTLYIPNRLNHGILRTSDAEYQFPINDQFFQNHIHGFLHLREHTVIEVKTAGEKAIAKTRYIYDETDDFFTHFPVKFQADYEFILDADGMHFNFTLTNLSDKQMPYGVCSHTAFAAPFTKNGIGKNVRLQLPITKSCVLSERFLSTGESRPLSFYDEQYLYGTKSVAKSKINTDMYCAATGELDGKPFYGAIMTDIVTGKRVCYEVDETFKFWVTWNDGGKKHFVCPEPMTWLIDAPNLDLPSDVTGYIELAPKESKTVTQRIFTIAEDSSAS